MTARFFLILLILCAFSERAAACAVCFGDPASDQTRALMAAMTVMLGVTVSVLAGIGIAGYRVMKRGAGIEN